MARIWSDVEAYLCTLVSEVARSCSVKAIHGYILFERPTCQSCVNLGSASSHLTLSVRLQQQNDGESHSIISSNLATQDPEPNH